MRNALFCTVFSGLLAMSAGYSPVKADDAAPPLATDIRASDPEYARMQRLFGAVRDVLEDAAEARADSANDTGGAASIIARQFGMDARSKADRLLSDAFTVVSDAPVTRIQEKITGMRAEIVALRGSIARLREDRISAPEDSGFRGTIGLEKDRPTIDAEISTAEARIAANEMSIRAERDRFRDAMAASGVRISEEEADLLLDSVTGSDLVRMAAAHRSVRGVSDQLLGLLDESGEDLTVAKRYYAMHTALLALIVHAQTTFIDKVDGVYLPKLDAITGDVLAAREDSERLLRDETDRRRRGLTYAVLWQGAEAHRWLCGRRFFVIAILSYTLYLVHMPLIPLAVVLAHLAHGSFSPVLFTLALLGLSLFAALLLHFAIEKPFLILKDMIARRRIA